MAGSNTVPLSVQDILDAAHSRYEQATDTPGLTDDDGKIRLSLLNEGINTWETENGVRWRELWTYNTTFGPLAAGTVSYSISADDFREFGSRIRFLRADGSRFYINLVSQENYARHINENKQVATTSGNPADGYQIQLGWIPLANDGTVGATGYYDYYRWALRMSSMQDVPELSNPFYLIDYITAELFANDDINLYQKFDGDRDEKLSNMVDENEKLPPFASNAIENVSGDNSYAMGV